MPETFETINSDFGRFVGKKVEIHARVFVLRESFLAASLEGYRREDRIKLIDDGQIMKGLLNKEFPAYGGGPVIFNEEAWITATAELGADGTKQLLVHACTIRRAAGIPGHAWELILDKVL